LIVPNRSGAKASLRWLDAMLLVTLVPCWIAAFALHVRQVVTSRLAWVPVYVSRPAGPEGFPVVVGFRPESSPAKTGLQLGDRLVRAGRADLRGVGPVGVVARMEEQADEFLRVAVAYERGERSGTVSLPLVPVEFPWRLIPLTLTFAVVGVLVLLRLPGSPLARTFLLAALSFSFQWTFFFGGPRIQTYAWTAVLAVSTLLTFPLILRVPMLFPPEVASESGRLPRWPWIFSILGPIAFTWVYGFPFPPAFAQRSLLLVNIAFIVALLAVLTRNFRRCAPIGRRQLKWVLYGIYVGTVPVLAADVVAALVPAAWWLHDLAVAAEVVIPISILIAILRFNLFDIDQLISAAAVYSLLSALVIALLPTVVLPSARWLSASAGLEQGTVQILLSGSLAATIVWARGRTRPYVDRAFFPERHRLATCMNELLQELSAAPDRAALLDIVVARLHAVLRPAFCAAYVRTSDTFQLVGAAGSDGAPSAVDPTSPLAVVLQTSNGPVDLQGEQAAGRGIPSAEVVLAFPQASVALPIHRGELLVCVILIGGKRSGDVYTATDLGLLGALAHSLSNELLRLDLERHTPKKLSEIIKRRPEQLEPRICPVTVMFVDIRDSVSIAETLSPDAFREFQQQYFVAMDEVVSRNEGVLVKTIGDALMAVWNAPEPVPEHAACCCRAATEMLAALDDLNRRWCERGWPSVDVRMGIVSGDAAAGVFGTARHVEYDIRGDTVNLASRLEGLNKAYGTRILVSDRTHAAAGDQFLFRNLDRVRVVGKSQPVEVYELLGPTSHDRDAILTNLAETFDIAVAAYRRRAFGEAQALFRRIARDHVDDGPSAIYLSRCDAYLASPPGAGWDAVFEARTK
jgi:class 3 adenylate cyclase